MEPFRVVSVWWIDPERDGVEQPLGRSVVGGGALESEFDPEANALVVTYTGDRPVETDRLAVAVTPFGDPQDATTRSLSEFAGDGLDPDEQFRIDGVRPGDEVLIAVEIDDGTTVGSRAVLATAVDAPGEFTVEPGDQVTVTYEGDRRPAGQYRVVVEDDPTATQFDDEYETLTGGEQVTVDAELGDRIEVQWVARATPVPVASETVTPEASFEATFDADSGDLTLTYVEGDPLDADRLLVEVPRVRGIDRMAWAEAYETVDPGDAITLTVDAERTPDEVVVVFDERALLDRVEVEE